jgi:hypothetical protein
MLAKRVIQVKLTVISESESGSLTAYVDTPLWRVESAETRNGKTDTVVHSHYPQAAARQLVKGSLGQVDPALRDVYTEEIAGYVLKSGSGGCSVGSVGASMFSSGRSSAS